MSRLIDADKLISDIEKLNLELFEEFKCADSGGMKITSNAQMYIICESVLPRIKEQPTAFDVEKVVEQLDNLRKGYKIEANNINTPPNYTCYYKGRMRGYEHSIDIVKRGGLDDISISNKI